LFSSFSIILFFSVFCFIFFIILSSLRVLCQSRWEGHVTCIVTVVFCACACMSQETPFSDNTFSSCCRCPPWLRCADKSVLACGTLRHFQ
jgi:hypothetical protein